MKELVALVGRLNVRKDDTELHDVFEQHRGGRVFYFPNPGNGGDSMIAAATYQILADYDIAPKLINANSNVANSTVFLGGGGNLVPMYQAMRGMLETVVGRGNRIVLLSHSIRGDQGILHRLGPEDIVCCREVESYSHVRAMQLPCRVLLTHDLALYLDVERLSKSVSSDPSVEEEFDRLLEQKARLSRSKLAGRSLFCMRRGVEKTFVPKGRNFDVSVTFTLGVQPGQAEKAAWMMLEFCRLADEITTNRLHVAIAAALSGTKLVLYDNSYGKVSGVYRHSIQGRFPNVTFREAPQDAVAVGEHRSAPQ